MQTSENKVKVMCFILEKDIQKSLCTLLDDLERETESLLRFIIDDVYPGLSSPGKGNHDLKIMSCIRCK